MQVVLDHIFLDTFRKQRNSFNEDTNDFESWLALKKFLIKGNINAFLAEENVPIYPGELEVLLKDTNAPLPFANNMDADTFKLNPTCNEYSDGLCNYPYLLYFTSFKNNISQSKGILAADLSNYLKVWNKLSLKNFSKQIQISKTGDKENKFKSWSSINSYSHQSNNLILVDGNIIGYKKIGIELNIIEVIKLYLNQTAEVIKHVTIISTHNNSDLVKVKEQFEFIKNQLNDPNIKFQGYSFLSKQAVTQILIKNDLTKNPARLREYPLLKYNNPLHDRYLYTNYFSVESTYGFDLLRKTKYGDFKNSKNTKLNFYPFVIDKNETESYYQNAKSRLKTYLQMIVECNVSFKEEIVFYGEDFVNPLFKESTKPTL